MASKKRVDIFSIILVPPGGRKPRTLTMNRSRMVLAGIILVSLLVLVIASLGNLGRVGRLSLTLAKLRQENEKLKAEQGRFAHLVDELSRLKMVEKRLARLMGIESEEGENAPIAAGILGKGFGEESVYSQSIQRARKLPTLWPVNGQTTRGFSEERGGHKGIDIAVARGTPVRAAGDGTVEFAGQDDVFGNMVIINHGGGISSLYGHNSRIIVEVGERVTKGQLVAYSGNTGRSSAPHLHFEISRYGRQVDPLTFLSEQ